MEKGDKILWDSGFGYEIGYYIGESSVYFHVTVSLISNKYSENGDCCFVKTDIIPYTEEDSKRLSDEYGYEHRFEDYE